MANFRITVSGTGVNVRDWIDPNATPKRINPLPEIPHRFHRVLAATGAPRFGINLDGVGNEPLDAALGGKLFIWSLVEQHSSDVIGAIPIPVVAGQSSVVQFTAGDFSFPSDGGLGHYLLMAFREGSGAVAVPFLVGLT